VIDSVVTVNALSIKQVHRTVWPVLEAWGEQLLRNETVPKSVMELRGRTSAWRTRQALAQEPTWWYTRQQVVEMMQRDEVWGGMPDAASASVAVDKLCAMGEFLALEDWVVLAPTWLSLVMGFVMNREWQRTTMV